MHDGSPDFLALSNYILGAYSIAYAGQIDPSSPVCIVHHISLAINEII